jgi:aspartyl-tRNA(Asn)/glutamyl-tRNA(Gln) amidotransferase subunit A
MPSDDPVKMPAHRLAGEIAARRLSPVDVVDAYLARIAQHEPKLQAYVDVWKDDARLAAEGADRAIRAGHAVGPLHGVPVALKDLIEIEGRVVTGGCGAWRNRVATRTAPLAQSLIAQGMIVLGKTHTVQFAMGGWGTNTQMGTPWNPWDMARKRTPGGSSSGSGVALAAGLAPLAVGTDTGGSVRLPSAWCGLTGLKTTVGRVNADGILPLSTTLDTPGPMARSVEDAALFYGAMCGGAAVPGAMRRGVRGLRLARMPDSERAVVQADVLAAYDAAIDELARQGAEIVAVRLPFAMNDLVGIVGRIISAEAYEILSALVDDTATPLDEDVRPRVTAGRNIGSQAYLAALRERARLKREFAAAMDGIDALLTPTVATTAIPLEEVDQTGTPSHFTRFGNLLDLCALSLPNGFSAGGLPISLQIVCRGFDEDLALRIGWAYQNATEWHLRWPQGF